MPRSKLPCLASRVEIVLANFTRTNPPELRALDDHGTVVDQAAAQGTGSQSIVLAGRRIAAIEIESLQDETIIVRVCWICGDGEGKDNRSGPNTTIRVTARWGGVVVATSQVTGAGGNVRRRIQLAADGIDEIEIDSGDAALVDLCVVPVSQGLGQGWAPLKGFDYPLCLPVAHADYPCPGKPATDTAAETMALNRISYGAPGRGQVRALAPSKAG